MNQSLAVKNLKLTSIIVLEIVVRKIQARLTAMAIVTGCLNTLLEMVVSRNCRIRKISIVPAMSGSLGKLTPNPKSRVSVLIAKGVVKAINMKVMSKRKTPSKITAPSSGSASPR